MELIGGEVVVMSHSRWAHPVAAAPARERPEGLDKRASDAAPPCRRVDAELVEEHLAALFGVRQLHAGDEADRPVMVLVGGLTSVCPMEAPSGDPPS
jgi:hypothetical protein